MYGHRAFDGKSQDRFAWPYISIRTFMLLDRNDFDVHIGIFTVYFVPGICRSIYDLEFELDSIKDV